MGRGWKREERRKERKEGGKEEGEVYAFPISIRRANLQIDEPGL